MQMMEIVLVELGDFQIGHVNHGMGPTPFGQRASFH